MILFSIDKNVEIPKPAFGVNAPHPDGPRAARVVGLKRMGLGDSVFIPLQTIPSLGYAKKDTFLSALYSSARSVLKPRGLKMTTRALVEDGVDGIRVWVIAA